MKKITLLLSFVLVFIVCEKDLGPNVEGVRVTVGNDSITITNGTDNELRFFPVDQDVLGSINWAPYCLNTGLIIAAGDKETIPFAEIYGYKKGGSLVVHWWACHEVNGKLEPGDIESIVVSTTK